MICGQARLPGVSVSQVARRYDMNANLVFTWLRDPRFSGGGCDRDVASFLPVAIVEGDDTSTLMPDAESRIEFDLAGGHRMRVIGCYDADCLVRLIRGISA